MKGLLWLLPYGRNSVAGVRVSLSSPGTHGRTLGVGGGAQTWGPRPDCHSPATGQGQAHAGGGSTGES